MPNWCANRLTFSGMKTNTDDLKSWICGEKPSLPGRAKREGTQLFLAGYAGLLRPETALVYTPCPALTAHGVATEIERLYGRYIDGEITEQLSDSMEWGEPDQEYEDCCPDVTGPAWLIDNIAHFGG